MSQPKKAQGKSQSDILLSRVTDELIKQAQPVLAQVQQLSRDIKRHREDMAKQLQHFKKVMSETGRKLPVATDNLKLMLNEIEQRQDRLLRNIQSMNTTDRTLFEAQQLYLKMDRTHQSIYNKSYLGSMVQVKQLLDEVTELVDELS